MRRSWKLLGVLRWSVRVLLGLFVVLVFYGAVIEPRFYAITKEDAVVPALPAAWDGQRLAVISDLQVGMWLANTDTIARIVARLAELRPALVLVLGDFVYHPLDGEPEDNREDWRFDDTEIESAIALLRPLVDAGVPTYAVLGNHDYAMKTVDAPYSMELANRVAERLAQAGVPVLRNEVIAVERDGQPLYLVGISPHWPGQDRPVATIGRVPPGAARIVMMHNPQSFPPLPAQTAPFAVAGHTHGGQIRIPWLPHWSWLDLVGAGMPTDGWAREAYGRSGNRLYINRGIGFSTLPIRVNCRPELTLFRLRRKP